MNFRQTIWLIGRSPDAEAYLSDHMQQVSFDTLRGFSMMQFRRWEPSLSEIETPADVTFGDLVRLRGYTIQGPDSGSRSITLLLYWEPLQQAALDYKIFVHLIGPPHPDTPLWDQDDHFPLYGAASTQTWEIGALLRDPYHLLDNPALVLAPADYTIEVGFYDPATNTRLPVEHRRRQLPVIHAALALKRSGAYRGDTPLLTIEAATCYPPNSFRRASHFSYSLS